MAVEERYSRTRGKSSKRYLTRGGTGSIFHELLAFERCQLANRGMGEFNTLIQYFYFTHIL